MINQIQNDVRARLKGIWTKSAKISFRSRIENLDGSITA